MEKFSVKCDQCQGKGQLWLGGGDYLVCPQCEGRKTIEIHQHTMQARTRTVFIPGCKPHIEVLLPRSLVTDIQIARKQ